ncbi:calcium uptake protein 2, mitochondrial-like isoform X2 [Dendronephthya gigantea]|uniref:calcium uptake protein 2, mitochondrial-like isoform X2 n=1 Tax=Dendronephthya gigantea TaxID=151771 RepID=UPI00106BC88D|nr:calcium uptake protein 2, mitochondrial-like isoform X2 [Dendronephthya gigantea]
MSNVFGYRIFSSLPFSKRLCSHNQSNHVKNFLTRRFYHKTTNYSRLNSPQLRWLGVAGAFVTGTCYGLVKTKYSGISQNPLVLSAATSDEDVPEVKTDLTLKQMKFEEYASYEYRGKRLMSPQDFLNSLVDNKEGALKKGTKKLTTQDMDKILQSTQQLSEHKEDLFTHMGENGIITYPEYLFLLTLLTKSSHGLNVAFRMLDLDGNATLGKTEFQALERMLNQKTSAKSLEKELAEETSSNSSLLIYFFGKSGKGQLTFADMLQFTRNLQKEFWKQEFRIYSAERDVMNSEQFAKLLLQSTQLDEKDVEEYLERLAGRVQTNINVDLKDYIKFGEFLNNLEEFSIALKIYNVANQPVTQEEFKRAVLIATGGVLGDHIVNTIFKLFDIDGDGKLSQKEFLGLMKDRVNKRFTARVDEGGFVAGFMNCVKNELVQD